MDKDNRYFIGKMPASNNSKIYKVIVGLPSQQVTVENGNKVIIKLPKGDTATHECLNSFKEITHEEAIKLTSKDI